jgi:hypothetical protein
MEDQADARCEAERESRKEEKVDLHVFEVRLPTLRVSIVSHMRVAHIIFPHRVLPVSYFHSADEYIS